MNFHRNREGDEWRPDGEYPYQPSASTRPRRRRQRKPSLLDAIKEESIVAETMGLNPVKIEQASQKRKKAPSHKNDENKRRRLMRSANAFAKKAREKGTLKWHKCCRENFICTRESSERS